MRTKLKKFSALIMLLCFGSVMAWAEDLLATLPSEDLPAGYSAELGSNVTSDNALTKYGLSGKTLYKVLSGGGDVTITVPSGVNISSIKIIGVADDNAKTSNVKINDSEVQVLGSRKENDVEINSPRVLTFPITSQPVDHKFVIHSVGTPGNAAAAYFYVELYGASGDASYDYTVKAIDSESNELGVIASGSAASGSSVKVPFKEFFWNSETKVLYKANAIKNEYNKSFVLSSNGQVEQIVYTQYATDVVYYTEAEDISGMEVHTDGNADIRCSNAAGACARTDVTVTNLPAGKYKIFGQVWGSSGVEFKIKAGDNEVWTLSTAGYITSHESDAFTLTAATDIVIPTAGGGGRVLDLIYITKLPDEVLEVNVTETVTWPSKTETHDVTDGYSRIVTFSDETSKDASIAGYSGAVEIGSSAIVSIAIPNGATNIHVEMLSSVNASTMRFNGDSKTTVNWAGNATDGYTYGFDIDDALAGNTYTIKKGDGGARLHKFTVTYTLGAEREKSTDASATFIYNAEELEMIAKEDEANFSKAYTSMIELPVEYAGQPVVVTVTPATRAAADKKGGVEGITFDNNVATMTAPAAGLNNDYPIIVTAEDGTTKNIYHINIHVAENVAVPTLVATPENLTVTSNSLAFATQTVKVSGENLVAETATVALGSSVAGMTVSPAEITINNGVLSETDITVSYFDKNAVSNGNVNILVTAGDETLEIPVTYSSVAYNATALATAANNQITTWNFAQTGLSAAVTVPAAAGYVNMKDVDGVTGANFSDATILVGNAINTTIYTTGINADKAKIKIPAAGKVSVVFSDVSSSSDRKNRIVSIAGNKITDVTSNNSTKQTAEYNVASSGEVEILGYIDNGSGSYTQSAQVRIYSITYTPSALDVSCNISSATAGDVVATVDNDAKTITATIPYEGKTEGSSIVSVSLVLADNGATASPASPVEISLDNAAGSSNSATVTVSKAGSESKEFTITLTRGAAKSGVLYVTQNAQTFVLSKTNLDACDYFTASNASWKDRTIGTTTDKFDDLKNSNNILKVKAYGATSFEVNVNNSNAARNYKVKVTDANGNSSVKTYSAGGGTESSGTILTNTTGEFTVEIIGAGENATVYPYNIVFYTAQPKASAKIDIKTVKVGKNVTVTITGETNITAVAMEDETNATVNVTSGLNSKSVTATLHGVKMGSGTIIVTLAEDEKHTANTVELPITVKKTAIQLSYSPASYEWNKTTTTEHPAFTTPTLKAYELNDDETQGSEITPLSSLNLTYATDDAALVTVTNDGVISIVDFERQGSAAVYAEFAGNDMYEAAEGNYSVNIIQGVSYKVELGENGTTIGKQYQLKDKEEKLLLTATYGGWQWNEHGYAPNPTKPSSTKTDGWGNAYENVDVAPIDGYKYAISGLTDAMDESRYANNLYGGTRYGWFKQPDYTDANDKANSITKSYPFTLPVRGSYMTFEPAVNGMLTVYILQNGAWNTYSKGDTRPDGTKTEGVEIKPGEFRPHSFFVVDYEGTPVNWYTDFQITTKQKVTKEYKCIRPGHDGYDPTDMSNIANWTEFNTYMSPREQQLIEENWANGTRGAQTPIEMDNGSFLAVQKGIVKYTFYVVAGETYYLFSNMSKLGFSGMNFVKDETGNGQPTATLGLGDKTAYEAPTIAEHGQVANISIPQFKTITLTRSMSKDKWNTIYLPFSMTEAEVKTNFGNNAQLILLEDAVTDEDGTLNMNFIYHEIQSILAGYPYLIYPTQDVSTITVNNKVINPYRGEMTFVSTDGNYTAMGTQGYCPANVRREGSSVNTYSAKLNEGDIYLNGGRLYVVSETPVYSNGYRSYIKHTGTSENAKALKISMRGFSDGNNGEATGIDLPLLYETISESLGIDRIVKGVYNLNGQKISDSVKNLPAGFYVVNGKKMIVK